MRSIKKIIAFILAAILCAGSFAACGSKSSISETESTELSDTNSSEIPETVKKTMLTVGCSQFEGIFSPFYVENEADVGIQTITQVPLITSDRTGSVIYNGVAGEKVSYNGTDYTYYGISNLRITKQEDGTAIYDIIIRNDVKFSDGTALSADDVIFNMYVLCDPAYEGSVPFSELPIVGLDEYRSGMNTLKKIILEAGNKGYTDTQYFTKEEYEAFWAAFAAAGAKFAQEIVNYCVEAGYAADKNDVSSAAKAWGYSELPENATVSDFFNAIVALRGYDLSGNGINHDSAGTSISSFLDDELGDAAEKYGIGLITGEASANISGITKTGENSVRIIMTELNAESVYKLCFYIAPMHYYGDIALYDYDNNNFGFTKGNLSKIHEKNSAPMGAGPYKLTSFENGTAAFEANENDYLGEAKIKNVEFVERNEKDKVSGIIDGTIDIAAAEFTGEVANSVIQANNGEINGDTITVRAADNLAYGYLGMNAKVMSVGGDAGSDPSKNLRKAFATLFSVYREEAVEYYYGKAAKVIEYPISDTSWAALRQSDEGYATAFSINIKGENIYTAEMSKEERYTAAAAAALEFFRAAGYTAENGKLTAAPDGASLEYQILIPGNGVGDHPAFKLLSLAAETLMDMGMKIVVTDVTDLSQLWSALRNQTCAMWCSVWAADVEPDLYQIYYSDAANAGVSPGGSNYQYGIADINLDKLLQDAELSADQEYRKAVYKACFNIISDWAVELPLYQRQNFSFFSTERINADTVPQNITPFYGWLNEIADIEFN